MAGQHIRTSHSPALMVHIIPNYPDYNSSLLAAEKAVRAGADILELQFPFSDPSADGPIIQEACKTALEQGFTVQKGFQFVSDLTERLGPIPIFIMTYANIIYTVGIPAFVERCSALNVHGLIVPDLPPDSDEGLEDCCRAAGIANVGVTLIGNNTERLPLFEQKKYMYVSLRRGVTGSYTKLQNEDLEFLQSLRRPDRQIIAGFGIRTAEQVRLLSGHCDIVVVGSALVEIIRDAPAKLGDFLQELLQATKPIS